MYSVPKPVMVFADTSATAAGTQQQGVIDRKGYNFVQIALRQATIAAASNRPTTMKISESDITDATGYAAIVKFTGGTQTSTSVGFVIASSTDTAVTNMTVFNIDCRGRKRYLKLEVVPATTQVNGASAIMSRGEVAPVSAANAGVLQLIEG
jgi:hypothetical protein